MTSNTQGCSSKAKSSPNHETGKGTDAANTASLDGMRRSKTSESSTTTIAHATTRSFPRFANDHPMIVKLVMFLRGLDGRRKSKVSHSNWPKM